MPEDKPRYLMGVGKPADIGAVLRGVDMFDCVPTVPGAPHRALPERAVNIRNARHEDTPPRWRVQLSCLHKICRAYLHHLFKADEIQKLMLLTGII